MNILEMYSSKCKIIDITETTITITKITSSELQHHINHNVWQLNSIYLFNRINIIDSHNALIFVDK